jgi:hypothetical protein
MRSQAGFLPESLLLLFLGSGWPKCLGLGLKLLVSLLFACMAAAAVLCVLGI